MRQYIRLSIEAPLLFMVMSITCGVSRPVYGGLYILGGYVVGFFFPAWMQRNMRIVPPSFFGILYYQMIVHMSPVFSFYLFHIGYLSVVCILVIQRSGVTIKF